MTWGPQSPPASNSCLFSWVGRSSHSRQQARRAKVCGLSPERCLFLTWQSRIWSVPFLLTSNTDIECRGRERLEKLCAYWEAEDTGAKLSHLWLTLREVFLKFKRMVLQNHPALFIHFFVFVCIYVCMCGHICLCMCMCRPENSCRCHFPEPKTSWYLRQGFSHCLELTRYARLGGQWAPGVQPISFYLLNAEIPRPRH